MTDTARRPSALPPVGEDQFRAADPMTSVWVGASAGTGKTKVLIDRVLRLMLPRPGLGAASATRPERILCLTFTRTAAAEMAARVHRDLSRWAVIDDAALDDELHKLTGAAPDDVMRREARRLFARVLDAPGGIRIMTIHSFCQSVLKRFPVEAGLPPHFELMDEQSAVEYLTRCLHDLIAETRRDPAGALAAAFDTLVTYLDQPSMSELMAKIMAQRSTLHRIFRAHGDAEGSAGQTLAAIARHLGLSGNDISEEAVVARVIDPTPEDGATLRRALRALLSGSANDLKAAAKMQPWLEADTATRIRLLDDYAGAFLTEKNGVMKLREKPATQKALAACPDATEIMAAEGERMLAVLEQRRAARLYAINRALFTVAARMTGRYAEHKRVTDRLDYDDLIIHTVDLLQQDGMIGWVLYKLDEGIDHILVDEAQDTSPQQWKVVCALADEFLAGAGSRDDRIRTLFVVGDEKQSIFSFQGADPAEFSRMRRYFGDKVRVFQQEFEIFLRYSFRSTRTVLGLVDSVFADVRARRGVVADPDHAVLHLPFRDLQAGRVELWPLIEGGPKEEMPPWQPPLATGAGDSPAARMARKVAETVAAMVGRETLESKARPVRAGDVMVLVQSRSALVGLLLRALKEAGVPVAGIDRVTLSDEIAVMDMLALAAFALQPRDDLALATVLKSPLVGLGDDDLFALCHQRGSTLLESLRQKRRDIFDWVEPFIAAAARMTPYEFFARLLALPAFADAVSGRRAFYARLGGDIEDSLDEFLNACLAYEQSHTPSVQKFVDWFGRGATDIKREQEGGHKDQVRIMTVHASKGLQAPIVFLPDTARINFDHNKGRARLLWPAEEDASGVPLWSPRKEFDARAYEARRADAQTRQEEEYRRLLYVALTRAEDRLYIGGYYGSKKPKEDCWYHLVERSLPPDAARVPFMTAPDGATLYARVMTHPQQGAPEREREKDTAVALETELPGFARRPPPAEDFPPAPLAPSAAEDEPAVRGPLDGDAGYRFRRGLLVHQLLETLPQLPDDARAEALARYLARPALGLPAAVQEKMAAEVMAVMTHPDFAPIFGPSSRAEVPVVGLTGGGGGRLPRILSGQMDRIVVTDDAVMVIDYKTNRPPPDRAEDVDAVYLRQMAAYVSVLRQVYPGKPVRAALLWTDRCHLMPLPDKLLDPHMP